MCVSLMGYAVDMRHPRVHVPAFPVSSLPGVTVSLKAGQSTYNRSGADALQLPLRFSFRARLTAGVRLCVIASQSEPAECIPSRCSLPCMWSVCV
jgi:hypothetical protein